MLLVFPFCARDREQAARLAEWITELGPYPTHSLLIVREHKAAPFSFGFGAKGFHKIHEIIVRDPDNKWPKSAGLMFRSAAKQIQYTNNEPFFWIEPDCVPMREGWLDNIAAEYDTALKSGKHFLGDMIDHRKAGPGYVPHVSGVCVYPKDLVHLAGEIFYAYDDVPFDIATGPAIHSQAKQSELIFHVWNQNGQGLSPFKDWSDVEQKIFSRRPKCALFHSDKTGTLLGLLRERKNFSGGFPVPVSAEGRSEEGSLARLEPTLNESHPTPPAENNLPVPVLADLTTPYEPSAGDKIARESTTESQSPNPADLKGQADSRGGQFISPWADKAASIDEIKTLAVRLRSFQTDMAKTRLVRQLLHDAGVIKLAYRFAKRKGWKKKKHARNK